MQYIAIISLIISCLALMVASSRRDTKEYLTEKRFERMMRDLGVEVYCNLGEVGLWDTDGSRGKLHSFIEQKIGTRDHLVTRELYELAGKLGYTRVESSVRWEKIIKKSK